MAAWAAPNTGLHNLLTQLYLNTEATQSPGLSSVLQSVTPQQAPWQEQYAKPHWQNMLTKLTPQQEGQFEAWAKSNRAPITPDYDMRGFWLHRNDPNNRTAVNPNDHMLHFPDTYKTPLHQSFSGESIYANPTAHPPMWNDRDQLVTADGRVLFDERAR